jgi:iodotyrosine deiodinase
VVRSSKCFVWNSSFTLNSDSKMEKTLPKIPFKAIKKLDEAQLIEKSKDHFDYMNSRRSLRNFSETPIPKEVLENLVKTASTAPSGANKQPWSFCIVTNVELKKQIRAAAEAEEYESYHGRMPETWINDLAHLGTNWEKPFLEIAPALIIVFRKPYNYNEGVKDCNYYVNESVGLACGFLLQAIHELGLVSLTHTPSPMDFLGKLLGRPANEKPFLLIPVGYPCENAHVPDISRKSLNEIAVFFE